MTLLLVALAAVWAAAVAQVAWMLSHPPRRTYAWAVARGRPGEPSELPGPPRAWREWTVSSRGLVLRVWEIAGDHPTSSPGDASGAPTIVVTHGWGDSMIGGLSRVGALGGLASRLVLWELPGHGEAGGVSRLGTAEVDDLLTLVDGLGPGPIVLYGWSLGAGVSIAAARRHGGIAAVIAESPYRLAATPARNVLRARGLPHRFVLGPALGALDLLLCHGLVRRRGAAGGPRVAFDRAVQASQVRCPLLVLHGELDEICPVGDGRAIADAAPRGELAEVPGGGHNDLWTDPALAARCAGEIQRFLAGLHRNPGRGDIRSGRESTTTAQPDG